MTGSQDGGDPLDFPRDMPDADAWASLTLLAEKKLAFGKDLYFRECWADCAEILGGATTQTLAPLAVLMFKPDAVVGRRMVASVEFIKSKGFVPVAAARVRLNRHSMRELWQHDWHVYTVDRLELATLLYGACDMLMLVLADTRFTGPVPGSARLADMKGPSNPDLRTPEHLRVRLQVPNRVLNFIHVCDEPADIVREFGIFFGQRDRRALLDRIKGGAGAPAWDDVADAIAGLEAAFPSHDLDFDRSLARLARSRPDAEAGLAEIRTAAGHGRVMRWDALCAIVDPADSRVGVWDFICVACAVLPLEREARGDFPESPGAAGWALARSGLLIPRGRS